jgi:hypothetical protein
VAAWVGDWVDRNGEGEGEFSGANADNFFYLTDVMFSVRAIVDGEGRLHTRLDYTPYGVAMHGKAADVNGDGVLNFNDIAAFSAVYSGGPTTTLRPGQTGYDPDADLAGSGAMDFFDYAAFTNRFGDYSSGPAFNDGWIDNPGDNVNGPDNSVGYDGYWFDLAGATEATSSGLYTVRHQVYDPKIGRSLSRIAQRNGRYDLMSSSPIAFFQSYQGEYFSELAVMRYTRSGSRSHPACARLFPEFFQSIINMTQNCQASTAFQLATQEECCNNYNTQCNMSSDWGGVVCCSGRKAACSWKPSSGNNAADSIINRCILAHERDHFSDVVSCRGCAMGRVCRPPYKPGVVHSTAECRANTIMLNCLRNNRNKCPMLGRCRETVDSFIRSTCRAVHLYCGIAGPEC